MLLNFRETDEQKIYVVSDLHLNHKLDAVWKARGFPSIEEHNNALIKSINDIVRSTDLLLNLGDFCLHSTIEDFEGFISQINCQNMYLLFGNHPNKHFKEIYKPIVRKLLGENYTENSEVYPIRYKNIIYVGQYLEVVVNGQMYILSHFPFMIWNHMQHGSIALCGHSHSSCIHTSSKGLYGKILDCSWDEFRHPLSLKEINDIVNNKRYKPIDHHA